MVKSVALMIFSVGSVTVLTLSPVIVAVLMVFILFLILVAGFGVGTDLWVNYFIVYIRGVVVLLIYMSRTSFNIKGRASSLFIILIAMFI